MKEIRALPMNIWLACCTRNVCSNALLLREIAITMLEEEIRQTNLQIHVSARSEAVMRNIST